MLAAVIAVFVLALIAPVVTRYVPRVHGWLLALVPFGLLGFFASHVAAVSDGETFLESYTWVPQLGVEAAFRLDGLSLVFALLVCGIGGLILIYSGAYLSGHPRLGRFYALIIVFLGSMLGLVLSDDLITLFVFWELTTIASYLLIGFEHERAPAREAALKALVVTSSGGLALLAGLVLLQLAAGESTISEIPASAVRGQPLYTPILALVAAGAFAKSAQAPFHFWLVDAMEAPTPVSAFLHSATMVKAGVFVLARFQPILGGTDEWLFLLSTVGALTMVMGGLLAILETDLKRVLAYSTVSALGVLVLLLGLDTELAAEAAIVFLVGHALYKGALFMVVGGIDHAAGARDVTQLRGLLRVMPITATAGALSALSMSGMAGFVGFQGKELFYESVLRTEADVALTFLAVLTGTLFVAVAGIAGVLPFAGKEVRAPHAPHEPAMSLWLPPMLMGLAAMGLSLGPGALLEPLTSPAVGAVRGAAAHVSISIISLTLELGLSATSITAGVVLFLAWRPMVRWLKLLRNVGRVGPARAYALGIDQLGSVAGFQTRVLQNGYLRRYTLVVIVVTTGLAGATLLDRGGLESPVRWNDIRFYEAGVALLIIAGALMAVVARSRLAAIAGLSAAGYGIALVYVLYGAPDLAIVQVLIETMLVIVFVFVFYLLPPLARISPAPARVRDVIVCGSAGAVMAALVVSVRAGGSAPKTPSLYFIQNSIEKAASRNVVNAILIDFRSFDTLGEIAVLSAAALGVYSLLKFVRGGGEGDEDTP